MSRRINVFSMTPETERPEGDFRPKPVTVPKGSSAPGSATSSPEPVKPAAEPLTAPEMVVGPLPAGPAKAADAARGSRGTAKSG